MKNQYSYELPFHLRKAFIAIVLFLFLFFVGLKGNFLFAQGSTGTAKGVATFECIGITWSGSGGNANVTCNVRYREAGSGSWKNGYPLWFDSRAVGNGTSAARPANEYRGSLVNLKPGTTYEIEVSLQGGNALNTFTCTTWSETFPIGSTHIVSNSSATLNITNGGTANAYELYTASSGSTATINVNNSADNCIYINAPYVIVRGLIIKAAKTDAIKLGPNAHDVVIENNDISGWGRIASDGWGIDGDAGIRVSNATTVERIIIQRNKIHHPRSNSNSWEQNHTYYNTNHPAGPQGITFESAGGNHVIRYNEIYSDATHYFNDGIGGAENFSFEGFPRANSDIYGNKISQTWDDGIEAEGGNMNVRIWGNYLDSTFVKIAVAPVSIGPAYIFRNVTNVSRRSAANDAATVDNEDRGPFIKAGTSYASVNGGKIYVFHNTILQPVVAGYSYPVGCGGGIMDWGGGPMTSVESRNNILHIHKSQWQSVGDNYSSQTDNDFDYDLYNGLVTSSNGQEKNGWKGTPSYSAASLAAGWPLASTSKGYDAGTPLNNFNDNYTGSGPDAGAYEAGTAPLQFGVNAYITNPPPPSANQPPVANAGTDIILTLPINSTTLNGSATDADGTIEGYAWSRISGPTTFTLGNEKAASTSLSGLVEGTYVFRLTVVDDNNNADTDDITVTVKAAANQLPVANAGNNITLTLPANSTVLNGSATDADGTISRYAWTYISGPSTFTLSDANLASAKLSGLVQGTYIFRLTVTDDDGGTDTDDISILVNAATQPNQLPTANAGDDINLTLPVNSTSLKGSGTDADGTISRYSWTRISGPTSFTLSNANTASTTLSGLVQGTYVFRLTVTDNDNATDTDDITINVNAAPPANLPPVANAGNNVTITLPVNSTSLTGSGTDADGNIIKYIWSRISGPTTFTMVNANAASVTLNGLVQGTYVFRLTVMDNKNAIGTDDVTVTVNAALPPPNQLPIANAGNDVRITLPNNTVVLSGSSSSDPDGTISTYSWSRISGPATFSSTNGVAVSITLGNLVQGVYVFRLTVTDNRGGTDTDDVTVTVNAAPPPSVPPVSAPNQVPRANAGKDIIVVLPTNSVTLSGAASTDPDGLISVYEWQQVDGPSQLAMSSRTGSSIHLLDLMLGTYTFELKVTDNRGASAKATVKVIVKNKNDEALVLNVYPNPTRDILNIQYIGNNTGEVRINIYDVTKKIVLGEMAVKSLVTLQKDLDVSRFSSGMYLIEVVLSGNKTLVRKFVKY